MLDEECRFPKATDLTFLGKLSTNHGKHNKFEMPKKSRTSFVIKHYAGEVAYEVAGFLDKNKDTLPEDLVRLLHNSSVDLIKTVFTPVANDLDSAKSGKKAATVGTIFKVPPPLARSLHHESRSTSSHLLTRLYRIN